MTNLVSSFHRLDGHLGFNGSSQPKPSSLPSIKVQAVFSQQPTLD